MNRTQAGPGRGRDPGAARVIVPGGTRFIGRAIAGALTAAGHAVLGAGQCLNIVEDQAAPMRLFYEQVISAAGASLELVRVPGESLPPDLRETGTPSQLLLASPLKAREVLGWRATAGARVLRRAVAWHLSHPPGDAGTGFTGGDDALAAAR
jgi:nucleoside-diphosphate-sugar epimerase